MAIYPPWLPPTLPVWVSWWQAQQAQPQTTAAVDPPISGPSPQNPPIVGTRTPDALISWQQAQARLDAHNAVAQAQAHTGNLTPPVSGALPVTKLTGVAGFCAIFGATAGGPPVPAPYTGPLDLAPALVGYSLRALSSAWRGQNVTTLRRDSDNATQAFVANATTGVFDTSGAGTFVGAGNGYHAIWNDQSGNGHDATAPAPTDTGNPNDMQPLYVASDSGAGSRSILDYFDNTDPGTFGSLQAASVTPPTQFTLFAVAKSLDVSPGDYLAANLLWSGIYDTHLATYTDLWAWALIVGSTPGTNDSFLSTWGTHTEGYGTGAYDSAYHVFELVYDSANPSASTFLVDGVAQSHQSGYPPIPNQGGSDTGNPTTGPLAIGGQIRINSGVSMTPFPAGARIRYAELIAYPSLVSTPTRSTIRQNIGAFYGITVAP